MLISKIFRPFRTFSEKTIFPMRNPFYSCKLSSKQGLPKEEDIQKTAERLRKVFERESKASYSRLIQSDPTGQLKDAHALEIIEMVRMNAVKRFEKNLEEELADIRSGKYVGVEESINDSDQNKITETNDDGETILAIRKDILDLKTENSFIEKIIQEKRAENLAMRKDNADIKRGQSPAVDN